MQTPLRQVPLLFETSSWHFVPLTLLRSEHEPLTGLQEASWQAVSRHAVLLLQ
jgi:hypothetical protein